MLGWMNVDIHQHRIEFQIEHIGRMTPVKQDIPVGLANGMRYQLVAHHASIDKKMLHIGL